MELKPMPVNRPIRRTIRRDKELVDIYSRCLITRNISIFITEIGKNIDKVIKSNIIFLYEGKCVVEGFIKQDSINILT